MENYDLDDFLRYMADGPDVFLRRQLRDHNNPLEVFNESEFIKRFRFPKEIVRDVIIPMSSRENHDNRGIPIPAALQALILLRFVATGCFQIVSGDLFGIAQPTISKIIKATSRQLASHLLAWVSMPTDTRRVRLAFSQIAEFPGVIGCIDCTHVPIKSPGGENGELYRNRKGWFSLNVQIVVGPELQICDIVCRWPGSVHDSRILHNSRLKQRFEARQLRGILLGDSGYPLLPYLFTPFNNPTSDAERRYNRSHIKTRNIVERAFGTWKSRFPCLSVKLRTSLATTAKIILSCAILHNLAINLRVPIPENNIILQHVPVPMVRQYRRQGVIERAAFVERHFGNI